MKLSYPITEVRGVKLAEPITEITINRRPKALDIYRAHERSKNEAEQTGILLSAISGRSPDEIAELDVADFSILGKEVAGFLESPPANSGAKS
jgi:hypothetical protein